jgi:hypothetical protein
MRISIFLIFSSLTFVSGIFSGFYFAKEHEDYGGAFLVSKNKLIQSKLMIERAWYPEGIIFSIIKSNQFCSDCKTIFSRDYFDFSSDHLSSTTNIIGTMPMETQKRILKYLNYRLTQTVKSIKDSIPSSSSSSQNVTHRKRVVGIIPFSQEIANPGSQQNEYLRLHQQIRQHFFQATFYSLYRYFPENILVYVASDDDKQLIESWNIPAKEIIVMDSILSQVPPEKYFFYDNQHKEPRPRNQLLPKYSLLAAVESFKSDPSWSEYRYVYYTEGDQILHLRKLKSLLRALDARNGKDALIPHRMQVSYTQTSFLSQSSRISLLPLTPPFLDTSIVSKYPLCDFGRVELPKVT